MVPAGASSPSPDLFQLALAHLHLWLLQRQVAAATATNATSQALSAVMQMLETAARLAAELALQGHDMAHFEAACQAARRHLDDAAAARALQAAAAATLPPLGDGDAAPCGPGSYRCPHGEVPAESSVRQEGSDLEAAKQRAELNLGSLPLSDTLANLLAALESPELQQAGSDVAAQHALCAVERELFRRAALGFATQPALQEGEVDTLVEIVDAYRIGALGTCLAAWVQQIMTWAGLGVSWAALAPSLHRACTAGLLASPAGQCSLLCTVSPTAPSACSLPHLAPLLQCCTASWLPTPAQPACGWTSAAGSF